MSGQHPASLPYHEPDIKTILILVSFKIFLNLIKHALDKILYRGLLGQVLLAVACGTPGGRFPSQSAEKFIVTLGYLGLLLIVFEDGLLTLFKSLKANLALSIEVATTGIVVLIGLSFC